MIRLRGKLARLLQLVPKRDIRQRAQVARPKPHQKASAHRRDLRSCLAPQHNDIGMLLT
jgi:hypothetical protein